MNTKTKQEGLNIFWDADKMVDFVCRGSGFKFKSNKSLSLLISLGPDIGLREILLCSSARTLALQ